MRLLRSCVILTGDEGSGKTSAMGNIMEALVAEGHSVSALIQPDEGRRPDGAALGLSMEFLTGASGKLIVDRVALARELKDEEMQATGYLAIGRLVFDRSVFDRAKNFIRAAVETKGGVDVLGIDEIGRLEIRRAEGLMDCLELALASVVGEGAPRVLVCSTRRDCLAELRRMAQGAGLRTGTFEISRSQEALRAVRLALESGS